MGRTEPSSCRGSTEAGWGGKGTSLRVGQPCELRSVVRTEGSRQVGFQDVAGPSSKILMCSKDRFFMHLPTNPCHPPAPYFPEKTETTASRVPLAPHFLLSLSMACPYSYLKPTFLQGHQPPPYWPMPIKDLIPQCLPLSVTQRPQTPTCAHAQSDMPRLL